MRWSGGLRPRRSMPKISTLDTVTSVDKVSIRLSRMAAVSVVPEGESRMLAARKAIRRVALIAMITAAALAALPSGTASPNSYSDQQRQLQTLIQQKEAQLHHLTHRANDLFGQLQETSAQLAATQNRLASLNMQLTDARAKLAAIDAEMNVVSAALQQKSTQLTTLIGVLDAQQAAVNKRIKDLQRLNALLSAIVRGAQRGQRVIQGVGGYLKWPVSGPITSPFGWRTHPVYGYRSFHTGIDIGVPMGTTVKAARYGKVIYTGWNGAFGLVVIIDHGNSLATMYAHLSRVFVSSGQAVRTLQSIAASGSTGWSTGPHLHFQVDLQGQPVNPMSWL